LRRAVKFVAIVAILSVRRERYKVIGIRLKVGVEGEAAGKKKTVFRGHYFFSCGFAA
jgi:hypothetical protein